VKFHCVYIQFHIIVLQMSVNIFLRVFCGILQVLRNIVYAKNLYDEMKQTVLCEANIYE